MPMLSRFSLPAVPAILLSIVSVQGGAALAKGLFPVVGAAGTTSPRIGLSALVMLAVVRPPFRQLQPAQWRAVIPYGLALGAMNFLFYCALARIPLGLAVTLEFIGPLVLALAGSRQVLDALWVLLAGVGIALVTPWSGQGLDLLGMSFALAAGGCWAGYIVLSQRTAAVLPGPVAVSVGMLFDVLPVLPFGIASGGLAHLTPHLLLLGAVYASLDRHPFRSREMHGFDLLPNTKPVESGASGVLKLDSSSGSHYLIGR